MKHILATTLVIVGALGGTVNTQAMTLQQEVTTLRPLGAKGLQQFLDRHAQELNRGAIPPQPLRTALDALCQQRDCYASRLYWYTDLEQAKAAAKVSGKPILSLRLLGRLDQDLSCANSRFFRVALYPNAEVSQVLRDRFILHWQSVRPVPKVTIDFGDGRTLERTLTGNSIHYVLDASGRPLDAIPGLYGPQAFLKQLQQSEATAKAVGAVKSDKVRDFILGRYHQNRLRAIETQWAADLKKVGLTLPPRLTEPSTPQAFPRADLAGSLAVSKMVVENPIVSAALSRNQLAQITDSEAWSKLARLYQSDATLDTNSQHLIQAKQPNPTQPLSTTVSNFETVMALDTVRNEYLLHSQIHQWFLNNAAAQGLDALNNKVYAELFLTPSTDPWLGLAPSASYSAIDNDGILKH